MKTALVIFTILLLCILAQAGSTGENPGDFQYYQNGDGGIVITEYFGADEDLVIPGEIDGQTVTGINNLFYGRQDTFIKHLTIPASVTRISTWTFNKMEALEAIVVDPENLTSVTLADGFSRLESWAFASNPSLTEIVIPASVNHIEPYVFIGTPVNLALSPGNTSYHSLDGVLFTADGSTLIHCSASKSGHYAVPEGVSQISAFAFQDCASLTSVSLPDGVASLERATFNGCTSLTKVDLPDSLASIGDWTFANCEKLTDISLPQGLTALGWGTFAGCSSLKEIHLPEGITWIPGEAFAGCSSLTEMRIPAVSAIQVRAFADCTGLTTIRIPAGVSWLETTAFSGCSHLTAIHAEAGNPSYCSVDGALFNGDGTALIRFPEGKGDAYRVPEGVRSIVGSGDRDMDSREAGAFENCVHLTSVSLPASVQHIGAVAFDQCPNLTAIHVDRRNKAFSSHEGVLYNADRTRLLRFPEGKGGVYQIPHGVESVGITEFRLCFGGCSGIDETPNSLRRLPETDQRHPPLDPPRC